MQIMNPFSDIDQEISSVAKAAEDRLKRYAIYMDHYKNHPSSLIGPKDKNLTRTDYAATLSTYRGKRLIFPYAQFMRTVDILELLQRLMEQEYTLKALQPKYSVDIDRQIKRQSRLFKIIGKNTLESVPLVSTIVLSHPNGALDLPFQDLVDRLKDVLNAHSIMTYNQASPISESSEKATLRDITLLRLAFVERSQEISNESLNHAMLLIKSAIHTHKGLLMGFSDSDADRQDVEKCLVHSGQVLSGIQKTQSDLRRTLSGIFEMGALRPGPFRVETYTPLQISTPWAQFGLDLMAGPVAR